MTDDSGPVAAKVASPAAMVEWSTSANGMFLNLTGRERHGNTELDKSRGYFCNGRIGVDRQFASDQGQLAPGRDWDSASICFGGDPLSIAKLDI